MIAMAHLRRYCSLSDAGAIAMRFPATSSRMYTSSVSDPLAKTSNTSSALSRLPSGRSCISASTAVRASLVIPSSAKWRQDYHERPRKKPLVGGSAGPPAETVEGLRGHTARGCVPELRDEG